MRILNIVMRSISQYNTTHKPMRVSNLSLDEIWTNGKHRETESCDQCLNIRQQNCTRKISETRNDQNQNVHLPKHARQYNHGRHYAGGIL